MPIRLRLALVFAALAALSFSIGAYLFATGLSSKLSGLLDSELTVQLGQVGRNISSSTGAPELPGPSSGPAPGEYVYQVLDQAGHVQGSSSDAGTQPLLDPSGLRRAQKSQAFFTKQVEGERTRLTAAPDPGHAGWVAVAGASLESIDRTMSDVVLALIVGGLVAVTVAGFGAYWLARMALRPVERMRREVAELSERDQEATIDVPATRDEIAALATTMNEILLRLQRALARQRAFVADASHELRTPFAVLQAELELASKPGRSHDELTEAIHSAADETARLSRLANDLLLLARSDEDQLVLRRADTDITSLFDRSVDRVGLRAEEIGVRYRVNVVPELRAYVDPDGMRQVIDNLVDNALRFAPQGTEIVLSGRAEGTNLVVEIADSGPGFPDDFLPHAFERFRRPDLDRARSAGGAGLGLAIVHAVVVAHGGRAGARNRPEGGAAVTLDMPGAVIGGAKDQVATRGPT
jgi:two-component system OmpR family sensor kinase